MRQTVDFKTGIFDLEMLDFFCWRWQECFNANYSQIASSGQIGNNGENGASFQYMNEKPSTRCKNSLTRCLAKEGALIGIKRTNKIIRRSRSCFKLTSPTWWILTQHVYNVVHKTAAQVTGSPGYQVHNTDQAQQGHKTLCVDNAA